MSKACRLCGQECPSGRRSYCGDDCAGKAARIATRLRDDKRLAACKRCQGPKDIGAQGRQYCNDCKAIITDAASQIEFDRGRRRYLDRLQNDITSGKNIRRRNVDAPDGTKWCARCQQFRKLSAFAARKNKPAAYCIPCERSYMRERRVKLHYGLSWDEYERLLASQNYGCAICGGKPRKNVLAVDHDHATGELRGLLCSRCNHKLLGTANDDPARLRKAADYLEQFAPRQVFGGPKIIPGFPT